MTNTTSATWLVPGLVDGSMSAEPATMDLDKKRGQILHLHAVLNETSMVQQIIYYYGVSTAVKVTRSF